MSKEKNDAAIKQLMDKVSSGKKAIGAKPRSSLQTNGIFRFSKDDYININVVSDPEELVRALAFLCMKKSGQEEANRILGTEYAFKFDGYTFQEWVADFSNRLAVLEWNAKKNRLDATSTKLHTLISEEARTEIELEKIAQSLSDIK